MLRFNMMSGNFSHAYSSTWWKKSEFIGWDYFSNDNDVSFYLDSQLMEGITNKNNGKRKFLWTIESPKFNNGCFGNIKNNLNDILESYELIFTYSDELLELSPKFKWVPAMGFWIESPKIHEKTKLVSMITSSKDWTEQQRFRVKYAKENKENLDLFGDINVPIVNKEEGLNDYMFSVCIENDTYDDYFTEKILDAFATGTIPIFKGTKNITKHFDKEGIIFLDEINLSELTTDLYYQKINSIKNNFEIVKDYNTVEDWIYKKYLSKLF